MNTTTILSTIVNDDCAVEVAAEGGSFVVRWHDFVANEWVESYPTLGAAFARVALLAEGGDTDWHKGFVHDPDEHVVAWSAFVAGELA